MRSPFHRHPAIIVTTIVITGLLVWGFWPQPVPVELVSVKRAPMSVTIEEEGRTRVHRRYVIAAAVDGVACNIDIHVGDSIKQEIGRAHV